MKGISPIKPDRGLSALCQSRDNYLGHLFPNLQKFESRARKKRQCWLLRPAGVGRCGVPEFGDKSGVWGPKYQSREGFQSCRMPPVVLPEEVLLQEERYAAKIEEMEEGHEESEGQGKKSERRDSTGSTGYSTCSSTMSSVSQQSDHSPQTSTPPPSDLVKIQLDNDNAKLQMADVVLMKVQEMQEINANIEVAEEEDAHHDADNEDTEAEKEEEPVEKPKEKLSAVDFVNQVCANQRCLSAGYKKRKEKGMENLRRGSNGYNTATEAKERLVTPASLGEAITNVIQKLEENIEELKVNHEMTIKQLEADTANKFQQFSDEQAKTIMKISQNISDAEGETNRIKEQHEVAMDALKDGIMKVSMDGREIMEEKEMEFNEKHEELDEISKKHELFIKELTDNLDRISVENKQSVESLLSNLESAKKENEIVLEKHNAAITELKELQEQSITDLKMDLDNAKKLSETFKSKTEEKEATFEEENIELRAKLDYHEIAIKALQNTLETVTEKNNDMHSEIRATHKKSIGDLRQEVFSQVMVVKEVSQGVQEEFNDKLENLSSILNNESSSNKQKIDEIREALDGVDMDIKAKMEETTNSLMSKIHSEVKQNGEGKYGIDLEISVVKDMLETLSNRVSTMNEKMYDFEANKRNNLIFYGIPNDPNESSESLIAKMQVSNPL